MANNTLQYDPDAPVYGAASSGTTNTVSGLLSQPQNQPRTITSEETVAGQTNKLLSSGSPLLKAAQSTAQRASNSKGLLNSSIASGEGTKAMIETAAPIAAQDASTYAASGLSAQNSNQELKQSTADTINSSYLKSQDLYNTNTAATHEGQISASLQAQKDQAAAQLQTSLKQMDINVDMAKLDASNKEAFSAAVAPVMQQYQNSFTEIQSSANASLSADEKAAAIDQLNAMYKPQLQSIANIYGYELEW